MDVTELAKIRQLLKNKLWFIVKPLHYSRWDMKEGKQGGIEALTIHYKVDGHYLRLHEFVTAAKSVQAIVEELNQTFFSGKIQYEIVILPPAPGTLKERIAVKLLTGSLIYTLGMATPEIASGAIEGFTGKNIAEWSRLAAESIKDVAVEEIEGYKSREHIDIRELNLSYSLTAVFLAEATKNFLKKKTSELISNGIPPTIFSKSYKAKNTFYEACYHHDEIRALGFDESEKFPIPRHNFVEYIAAIPPEEEPEEEWEWEITHIKVISPNWDRSDTRREWKARYGDGKEAYFSIEDDNFWARVDKELLKLKGKDSLKVQWAFIKDVSGKRKRIRVLRVLEYNGSRLNPPLTEEELNLLFSKHSKFEEDQHELFPD